MTKKLLILGDLLIDETYYVEASKLSPEGPCVVGNIIDNNPIRTAGGAGLAASYAQRKNIPYLFGTGSDSGYKTIDSLGLKNSFCLQSRKNVKKIRYIDKETAYHLIRIDNDKIIKNIANPVGTFANFLDGKIKENIEISCIVCLDYNKGFFQTDGYFPSNIIKAAKKYNIPVYIDSRHNVLDWVGATTIKLNKKECFNAIDTLIKENKGKSSLRKELDYKNLIVTEGEKGAGLSSEKESFFCKAPKLNGREDITGCGDVFDISFCYYYYTKEYSLRDSLQEAVNNATKYAYTSIKTRLCHQNKD